MSELTERAAEAHSLWRSNPVLVHLFGLTPLLALSTTVLLATTLVALLSALTISASAVSSLLLTRTNANWRFVLNLAVLALLTTLASALLSIWKPALHEALGLYLPLLSCSLLPLLHLQTTAPEAGLSERLPPLTRLLAGYGLAVMIFAALREGLTFGALFTDIGLLVPGMEIAAAPQLLPFAATPAAGFMLLGLLAAAASWLREQVRPAPLNQDVEPAPRARVTEKLQ